MCADPTLPMLLTLIPSAGLFFLTLNALDRRSWRKHARIIKNGLQRHTSQTFNVFPSLAVGLTTWGVLLTWIC